MKYKIVAALGFLLTPIVVVAMADKPVLPSCDDPGVIETVKSMLIDRPHDFGSESATLAAGKWKCQATVRQNEVRLAFSVELVGPGTVRINVAPNPGTLSSLPVTSTSQR